MSPSILGMTVSPVSYESLLWQVNNWQKNQMSRYVCVANVHMVMEAFDAPAYQQIINQADLVTPDGMPLVWMLRRMGFPNQQRVYGPALTEKLLDMAHNEAIQIGFYGSSSVVLEQLIVKVKQKYPEIKIVFSYSPPFRKLSDEEDSQITEQMISSKVRILFVGLGCPKQERWMFEHRGKIPAVMLGVGAAFDFIAGFKPQAPTWIQKIGFEWLFRLVSEPKRLWKRYFHHNPRFLYHATLQLRRNKISKT